MHEIFASCAQYSLQDFLFQDYPEMAEDWFLHEAASKKEKTDTKRAKWCDQHDRYWMRVPFSEDKGLYVSQLQDNPYWQSLSPRMQDLLLLQLCHERFPGSPGLVLNLEMSFERGSSRLESVHCLVPRGIYWLKDQQRLLLGIESLLLQGADPEDLPALRPRVWRNMFLQNLAGNAFCAAQFLAFLVCALAV